MKNRKRQKEEMNRVAPWVDWLDHHLNGLHVYCRLVRVMPTWLAREIVTHWERTAVYGLMYHNT